MRLSFNGGKQESNFKRWLNGRWPLTELKSHTNVNSCPNDFIHPLFSSHCGNFFFPIQNITSLISQRHCRGLFITIISANCGWEISQRVKGMTLVRNEDPWFWFGTIQKKESFWLWQKQTDSSKNVVRCLSPFKQITEHWTVQWEKWLSSFVRVIVWRWPWQFGF